MKCRTGFVGNSSSASYIIKLSINASEFFKQIYKEMQYEYFSFKKFKKQISKEEKRITKSIKKEVSKKSKINWGHLKKSEKEMLNEIKYLMKKINTEDYENNKKNILIKEILKYNNIKLVHNRKEKCITLTQYTSMHNYYNQNMNKILREVMLFYAMETNIKMECEKINEWAKF